MKRSGLFLIFSFLFLFPALSQGYSGKDWFVGAGMKGNVYINDESAKNSEVWKEPTLAGELFVGKWFSSRVGGRVLFEGGGLHHYFVHIEEGVNQNYVGGRLDLLINATNFFRDYSPKSFYNLVPYVGLGSVHVFNATNRPDELDSSSSFLFGGGLMNTFRLSRNFSVYINLGMNLVDAALDGSVVDNNPFNGIASATIGLVINFGGN